MSIPDDVVVATIVRFHTFWFKRIGLFSLVGNYDPYDDSTLFLHGILTLADYLSETFRFFHIVLRASHLLIAGDACHNKVTPSGRSSTMAIYDATSCRTPQFTITPKLMGMDLLAFLDY